MFASAGIPQPGYIVLADDEVREPSEEALRFIERELGYPCFVKPCNGGSSVGVSKAKSREDFGEALASAARHDRKVMVEATMSGHEVECAVLGNADPQASGVAEIVPSGEFYTYEAKYLDDSAELLTHARIDDETSERVRELALRAFRRSDAV